MQEKQDKTLLRIAAFFYAALPWAIYWLYRMGSAGDSITLGAAAEVVITYFLAFILMFLFGKFLLDKYFPEERKQTSFDIKTYFLSKIIALRR